MELPPTILPMRVIEKEAIELINSLFSIYTGINYSPFNVFEILSFWRTKHNKKG
jgi:hypothetical protein